MKSTALLATTLLLLGVAIVQVALVIERLIEALIQWHHFAGSGQSGYTTLSGHTALEFYGASFLCLGLSVVMARLARPVTKAGRVLNWASVAVFSFGVAAFAARSVSPLNVWRPSPGSRRRSCLRPARQPVNSC